MAPDVLFWGLYNIIEFEDLANNSQETFHTEPNITN